MCDERSQRAVEASEQFADQLLPASLLDRLAGEAEEAFEDTATGYYKGDVTTAAVAGAASYASSPHLDVNVLLNAMGSAAEAFPDGEAAERCNQAAILRDTFGNPFRSVALDLSCLTWEGGTVAKLAQGIYDERAFAHLPILADALEEAGCDNADILAHCRSGGEHVRGCWVVDLLLNKK